MQCYHYQTSQEIAVPCLALACLICALDTNTLHLHTCPINIHVEQIQPGPVPAMSEQPQERPLAYSLTAILCTHIARHL